MCGRYLDRLERRGGTWKIAVRRATVELAFTVDASLLQSKFFKEQGYIKGTRDRTDLSYRASVVARHPRDEILRSRLDAAATASSPSGAAPCRRTAASAAEDIVRLEQ